MPRYSRRRFRKSFRRKGRKSFRRKFRRGKRGFSKGYSLIVPIFGSKQRVSLGRKEYKWIANSASLLTKEHHDAFPKYGSRQEKADWKGFKHNYKVALLSAGAFTKYQVASKSIRTARIAALIPGGPADVAGAGGAAGGAGAGNPEATPHVATVQSNAKGAEKHGENVVEDISEGNYGGALIQGADTGGDVYSISKKMKLFK